MTNVSALQGTSACCAGDSARSRDEPESVRLAKLLAVAAAQGLAPKIVTGFADRDVEHLLGLDPAREGALALVPLGRTAEPPMLAP